VDEKPYASSYDETQDLLLIEGSVDELAGPAFRDDLAKHSDEYTKPLRVDLSEVDFFPSLAVGVLAVAMRRGREGNAEVEVLARGGSIVARVLTICALPYTEVPADSV
jgi:anti-anti-sigma factor